MENNINLNNGNNNDNKSIVIKTIYGIIGGIQSILNIISGYSPNNKNFSFPFSSYSKNTI